MSEARRYQVFVSSTFIDLVEEREKILRVLLELDFFPAGMELFPAAHSTAWSHIQQQIDDSDFYILVIGGRYGSLAADGLSFTEREYHYAVSRGKEVLAFVHVDPGSLPVNRSELDPARRSQLEEFRRTVMDQHLIVQWRTGDDLAHKVGTSLVKAARDAPSGWVRADEQVRPVGRDFDYLAWRQVVELRPDGFENVIDARIRHRIATEIYTRKCVGDAGSEFFGIRSEVPEHTVLEPMISTPQWSTTFIHLGRSFAAGEDIDIRFAEMYRQSGPWQARNSFSLFVVSSFERPCIEIRFPEEMRPDRAFARSYLGDIDFGSLLDSRPLTVEPGRVSVEFPVAQMGNTYSLDIEWSPASLGAVNAARLGGRAPTSSAAPSPSA